MQQLTNCYMVCTSQSQLSEQNVMFELSNTREPLCAPPKLWPQILYTEDRKFDIRLFGQYFVFIRSLVSCFLPKKFFLLITLNS